MKVIFLCHSLSCWIQWSVMKMKQRMGFVKMASVRSEWQNTWWNLCFLSSPSSTGYDVVSWSVPKTLSIGKLGIDQELLSVTQTLGLKQVGNAPILYVFLYMFVLPWNKVFSSTPSQVPVSAHCSYHKEWMEKKLEKPDPSALGIMRAWTPWAWGRVWTRLSLLWWLGQWWWVQF